MPSIRHRIIEHVLQRQPRKGPGDPDRFVRGSRRLLEQAGARFKPASGVKIEPIEGAPIGGLLFVPRRAHKRRTIVYAHGGGYIAGSPQSHRSLVSRIAKAAGCRVWSLDYRRAPETPFPGPVEDVLDFLLWLQGEGVKPKHTILAGDSAGGGLVLSALLRARDRQMGDYAGAVLISPWTDLSLSGLSVHTKANEDPYVTEAGLALDAELYLDGLDPTDPIASPVFADLTGLPPLLIHVGEAEILLDDSTRLAGNATAARVPVDLEVGRGLMHVWHFFAPFVPEAGRSIKAIGKWARKRV